jgi:hypothetical protein
MDLISAIIPDVTTDVRSHIAEVLGKFSEAILRRVAEAQTVVRPLKNGERYNEASPALQRLGVDVDAWPAPPAGLFVVEERAVYLRSCSPMTISHELGLLRLVTLTCPSSLQKPTWRRFD